MSKQFKVTVTDEFGSAYTFINDDVAYITQVIGQWLQSDHFIDIVIQPEE